MVSDRHGFSGALAGVMLGLVSAACGPPAVDPSGPGPLFDEVAAAAGIDFVHANGARGEFLFPELMQGGAAWVDHDGDGDLDAYLVQSGPLPADGSTEAANRLYENLGDGSFREVPGAAGAGDRGYGSGVAAADYDGDGDVDLYVTNLGRNTLLRNDGPAGFADVTAEAGVGDPGYSTSAVFADLDGDGDLDLYVGNYVAWGPEIERECRAANGLRDYCSPGTYGRPQPDTLYRNEGNGRFSDVSDTSGIRAASGTGLGVVAADFDLDGDTDVFVANDQMANFLWINDGGGAFRDEALVRGCALNQSGRPEAGMGIALADFGDDGDPDLFLVHLDGETNTFYENRGGTFSDETDPRGLGSVSKPFTGFGVGAADFDCDGNLDLFVANGRVRLGGTMIPGDYGEPNQVLLGRADGTFVDVSGRAGGDFAREEVSRGAAFGDYDDDGDVDVLVVNNGGPARLLRNRGCRGRGSLTVQLAGPPPNRSGLGAWVTIEAGGRTWRRAAQPAYSYMSSNDPRVHVGLGEVSAIDRLAVDWPDGTRQVLTDVPANGAIVVEHPERGGA